MGLPDHFPRVGTFHLRNMWIVEAVIVTLIAAFVIIVPMFETMEVTFGC